MSDHDHTARGPTLDHIDDSRKERPAVLPSPLASTELAKPGQLRQVAESLFATRDEPFRSDIYTAGFLLLRPEANVFVYSAGNIDDYFGHLEQLGGVNLILLNHRDEAGSHVERLARHFGATVHAHAKELDACIERGVTTIEPLNGDRCDIAPDLVALHTPGHTPGVASYIWTGPNQTRYLFTSDTLSNLNFGTLAPHLLNPYRYPGNTADLRRTLTLYRDLDTDVLVPGIGRRSVDAYRWAAAERNEILAPQIASLAN